MATNLETLLQNLKTARQESISKGRPYIIMKNDTALMLIEIIRVQKKTLDKMICSPAQYMDSEDYFTIAHEASVKVEEIAGKK